MVKKICLSLSIVFLSITSLMQSNERADRIAIVLGHIAAAKKDILFEIKLALELKNRAERHFRQLLQEAYEPTKQACLKVISTIAESPEFAITLAGVTDEQVALIVDELVNFNDIIVDPSAYPLEKRVDQELELVDFEPCIEQFFNTLYVPYVVARGSRLLLERLELAREKLVAELIVLQPIDQ